jgi:hypothetical protein
MLPSGTLAHGTSGPVAQAAANKTRGGTSTFFFSFCSLRSPSFSFSLCLFAALHSSAAELSHAAPVNLRWGPRVLNELLDMDGEDKRSAHLLSKDDQEKKAGEQSIHMAGIRCSWMINLSLTGSRARVGYHRIRVRVIDEQISSL